MARKILLLVVCITGIFLVAGLLSLSVYDSISLLDAYGLIWDHICGVEQPFRSREWWADLYIWDIAMPHICLAITAGASLAICGALMQALMNNPLADPYSTGISSGACLGAVTAIIVGATFATATSDIGLVTNAFIGALIPALLIIVIAERIRMTPATLILIGIALSYLFNSIITYLMVSTDADTLQRAYVWQVGSLNGLSWSSLPLMFVVTVFGSAFVFFIANQLNILSLGDTNARSLGLDVRNFRVLCLIVMSVMTASVIAFTGIIGFVGLVAPHVVRLAIGSDNKFVIPISMAVGALFLLVADYIAMMLSNIPVGVVMSLLGSPVFFALIVWRRKGQGALY